MRALDEAASMKLRIITTGGTMDKLYYDANSEYEVGEPQIGDQQPSDSGQAAGTPAPLLGRRNAAR